MRAARAEDARRRLRERLLEWKFQLEGFAFSGIPSIGEGELSFASPFTVICGPNGVGKTTLLRAIWATVSPDSAKSTAVSAHKLPAGTASLSFTFNNESKVSQVTFAAGIVDGGVSPGVEVTHLDIASALPKQQEHFCSIGNIADVLNGVGAKALDSKELVKLNHLAKRDYREVRLFEVDGIDGDVLPYFEVALGDSQYDSRAMGAGEFAIFYLWWAVERAQDHSMILIEEPECHLSPSSQVALCDFLVEAAVSKKLTFVVTSHSAQIISAMSDDNLIFVYREAEGIQVVDGPPPPALLETIGIRSVVDTILFVEDDAGLEFARFLLESLRPDLSRRTEIADRQGNGNVIAALKKVGPTKAVSFIGLFDGDIKGTVPEDVLSVSAFLPGAEPIEKILRKMVEADPNGVKQALGREDLGPILFGLKGAEHHEWYEGFCRHLGQSRKQMYPTLFRLWMRQPENEMVARQAIEQLAKLYRDGR